MSQKLVGTVLDHRGMGVVPDLVAGLDFDRIAAVWIDVPDKVLEARVRADEAFCAGASDPGAMARRFAERSAEFQLQIRARTSDLQLSHLRLTGEETVEEAAGAVLRVVRGGSPYDKASKTDVE